MPPLAPTKTRTGEFVRRLRLERGETQEQFGATLGGYEQGTISRVEGGNRPLSEKFAYRLIRRVGADPEEVARYVGSPGFLNLFRYPGLTIAA